MLEENSSASECKKFLRRLREKGKAYPEFRLSLKTLEDEASKNGLDKETIKLALEILMNTELNAANSISIIKCMIPRDRIDDKDAKRLIAWFLTIPVSVTTLTMMIQWIIGCWEYQLINRNSIYIFYDSFFYTMLKQDKLELRLAHLIYLMTKPEDVTRRQVTRLLNLSTYYRKPSKHITALLSLFKSYKPEFVPENIAAINIQSTWRPIPESLRRGFEDARDRIILREAQKNDLYCDWNIFNIPKSKKNQEPLLPSVKYFNIGSNIFSNKTEKSIFDVSNAAQLGQYHSIIKLPCNATSLLTNVIGYHLLTYADLKYQQRFMYNLYYTLWRSFIFENGRYSSDEMNQILDLTMEFSKYMQHGISIVNYFINEYLSCYMDKHEMKLLSLMQWSSLSVSELKDYVLKHMKLMFYSSSMNTKCKIIRTLRKLLLNIFVANDNAFKDKSFPFLGGQNFNDKLTEYTQIIENFSKELITSALNIHNFNSLVVSEALSYYEQMDALDVCRKTSFLTLAPPAVIYGCFVTKSCALLSRVCALLLQYRRCFKQYGAQISTRNIQWLIVYAEDLVNALWYDNCFTNRNTSKRYFLKSLSESTVKSSSLCNIDKLLNIHQHYAVLPYMFTLSTSGLEIKTKKDASSVAAHYYCHVNQLISALLGIKDFISKV